MNNSLILLKTSFSFLKEERLTFELSTLKNEKY